MIWWFWALTIAGAFLLGYKLGKPAKRDPRVWTLSQIEELRDRLNGDRAEIVDGAPWVYGRDFTMGPKAELYPEDDGPQSSPEAVAEIIDSWGEGRADWAASVGHGGGRVPPPWPKTPVYCQECGLKCLHEWTLVSEYGLSGVFHPGCLILARAKVER